MTAGGSVVLEEKAEKMDRSTKIKWFITVLMPVICFLIPESEFYTWTVKMFFVITIFSLCVIAFEFFSIAVMALLMPALWGIFQVAPMQVIMSPWLGNTMLACVGGFLLAGCLEESGLLKRISYWIMMKTAGSYMALLMGLYVTGIILTSATFGSGYIVMAALCYGLCKSLDIMGTKMSAAIALACMLGTCSAKSFTYCVTVYAMITGMAGPVEGFDGFTVNFFQAIGHNWPMGVVCAVVLFVAGKWYKQDREISGADFFKKQLADLGPIKAIEKKNIALLVVVVTFLLTNPFHKIDSTYGFMIFPWLMFMPFIKGATTASLKSINWEMIFFIAGCMSIGVVAGTLGFGTIIKEVCMPIFADSTNIFVIFGSIFGIVFLLNFLMTPMAIWALLTGPIIEVSVALNMDPRPFMYALVHCAEAIVFPYEYVPYLTVYAFGMMSMNDFIKLNVMRCIIYLIGFMLILVPYWYFIGVIAPLN